MSSSILAFEPAGEDVRQWLSDPAKAHSRWRASLALASGRGRSGVEADGFRDYATHTTVMYCSLFNGFCKWLKAENKDLVSVGADDIHRFIAQVPGRGGRPAKMRTRRMYLAEIDRVLAHLVALGLRSERPSSEVIKEMRQSEPLGPRSILLPAKGFAQAIRQYLLDMGLDAKATPRVVRDAACTILLLDCGISVKELQKLKIRHYTPAAGQQPARIHAPGHRLLRARDLDLSPGAAALLERWIALRLANVLAQAKAAKEAKAAAGGLDAKDDSDPAVEAAKAARASLFVQGSKTDTLRANTVHRAAVAACRSCGVAAGPQMLRNEFVAGLLRQHLDLPTIAGLAGLNDLEQVYAMKRVLQPEVDALPA